MRHLAGASILLLVFLTIVYFSLTDRTIEHRLPPASLLAAALLVAAIAFAPIWDRWPRNAFLLVIVLQSVVLALFMYSTRSYHP
jgi:hypothetical protein